MSDESNELLRVVDAVRILGIGETTIRKLCQARKIYHYGPPLRFRREWLDDYLRSIEVPTADAPAVPVFIATPKPKAKPITITATTTQMSPRFAAALEKAKASLRK